MKMRPLLALAVTLPLLTGCLSVDIEGLPICQGDTWSQTTLYLGRGLSGASIDDEDFRAFIADEVTPRFPSGFTMSHGEGAWKNTVLQKTIYEKSTMLIVLHPVTGSDRLALREIANAYRTRFHQQAVIEAIQPVCVTFVRG